MSNTNDNLAYRFPVSIKGILIINQKIPLLLNERDEYELPGGKLELNETPEQCVMREIDEELSISTNIEYCVDTWVYSIQKGVTVFIATYFCQTNASENALCFSDEHKSLLLCPIDNIHQLNMPQGYKNSIQTVLKKEENNDTPQIYN